MDIRSLQSFLAVAETGNFTHAAQALYVTQPTLSRRIASLEETLLNQF
jgi:DNA-binding transcriptional LysR family regulator